MIFHRIEEIPAGTPYTLLVLIIYWDNDTSRIAHAPNITLFTKKVLSTCGLLPDIKRLSMNNVARDINSKLGNAGLSLIDIHTQTVFLYDKTTEYLGMTIKYCMVVNDADLI